jgi:hypothetical protein
LELDVETDELKLHSDPIDDSLSITSSSSSYPSSTAMTPFELFDLSSLLSIGTSFSSNKRRLLILFTLFLDIFCDDALFKSSSSTHDSSSLVDDDPASLLLDATSLSAAEWLDDEHGA